MTKLLAEKNAEALFGMVNFSRIQFVRKIAPTENHQIYSTCIYSTCIQCMLAILHVLVIMICIANEAIDVILTYSKVRYY